MRLANINLYNVENEKNKQKLKHFNNFFCVI